MEKNMSREDKFHGLILNAAGTAPRVMPLFKPWEPYISQPMQVSLGSSVELTSKCQRDPTIGGGSSPSRDGPV